jgi:hypothetical protein
MSYHKRGSTKSYLIVQRRHQQPTPFRRPTRFKKQDEITVEREFLGWPISKKTVNTKTELTLQPSKLSTENQTSGGVGVGNNLICIQGSISKTNKTEIEFDKGKE